MPEIILTLRSFHLLLVVTLLGNKLNASVLPCLIVWFPEATVK